MAAEAFGVIREAMTRSGMLALGRVVLHQRERLMALEPRGKGIVCYSLRTYDEVRPPQDFFDPIPDAKPDAKMVDIAERIIEQLEGPFDPTQFDDRYEEALKALIAEKQKGHKVEKVQEQEDTNVVDLMDALRRSLGEAPAPRRPTGSDGRKSGKEPARRRAPAAKSRRA
jgi:DNA end-binding protein Ku